MNRKHLLGGVAAAALLIGGAMQAQATDAPSAFEPPPGWTGFHIGVGGGVNFLLSEGSEAFADYFSDDKFAAARADLGTADWFGTVEAGFDFQRNRLVFGILANYDFGEKELDMEGAGGWYDGGDDKVGYINARLTMENSWAIAARLGVLNSTQNTLWYGLIGYTRAEFEARECYWLDFYDSCDRDGGLSVSEDKGGLTVGAGVESLITDALSLKLEYRFTDFGSIRGFDDDVGWSGNGEEGFDFDPVDHSIRAVLSWRFGGIWGN